MNKRKGIELQLKRVFHRTYITATGEIVVKKYTAGESSTGVPEDEDSQAILRALKRGNNQAVKDAIEGGYKQLEWVMVYAVRYFRYDVAEFVRVRLDL